MLENGGKEIWAYKCSATVEALKSQSYAFRCYSDCQVGFEKDGFKSQLR